MSFYLFRIYKTLSPSLKFTIGLLLCTIVSGGIFFTLYHSGIAQLRSVRQALTAVEDNITKVKELQMRCAPASTDEKKLWKEVHEAFAMRVPSDKMLLPLMNDIARVAQECSIYDISFSLPEQQENLLLPRGQTASIAATDERFADPAGGDTVIPYPQDRGDTSIKLSNFLVQTSFHCRYQELGSFLKGVCALPRLLEVESLTIERKLPLMEVKIILRAFYSER